ncbi:ODA4 [Symbiodinium sp. CCMP2592]|nr:ODA4 [Symbiodinium sp. CCMP2592]
MDLQISMGAMVEGRVVAIEDTFLEVLLTQGTCTLSGRLLLGGASSRALGLCVGDDLERLRVVGKLPDGTLCLVPEDLQAGYGLSQPPGEMEEANSYSRQELLEQRRSSANCSLGGGAEAEARPPPRPAWAPQTAPYREEDFEAMLLQALVSGQLPPPWWSRCSAALKRKALLVALRVGSMQAVYAMQPESAAFRAQLQCFEPDGSFLSEAMSGIWDDAERAAATKRTSPSGPAGPLKAAAKLEDALQHVSEEGRGSAVAWLLHRGAPVAALLPEEPGPAALGIRLRGLKLLQDLGQQAAPAAAAVAGCLRDPEVRGRRAAAEALAALEVTGDVAPRAVPRLRRLLEQEADPQCRVAAAVALGSLGRDGCLAAEEALWHQDLDVRGLACVALEASKEASTSKVLVRWLQEGGASEVSLRARALQALARLLARRAARATRPPPAESEPGERELALETETLVAVFAVHATDPDAAVREASLLGLGALCRTCESCRELALPTLAAGLDDSEEAVREAAASFALAVEEREKGVVDESEPSSSRVVLRVLSILDRRAGARSTLADSARALEELTSNEEKLLVDMVDLTQAPSPAADYEEEAEIAIASLLGPPNKLSSGAVKQAWEVVHREASDGWVPKAREKGAPEDAKAPAKKKSTRKEESAAEEQVHPLPVAFRCRANAARVARVFHSSQTILAHRVMVTDTMQAFFDGLASARDYKGMSSWEKAATPTPSRPVQANVETSVLSSGVCGVGRAMDVPWTRQETEAKSFRFGLLQRLVAAPSMSEASGVSTIFAVRKEKLEKFLQLLGEDANSSRLLNHFLNEVEVPAVFFHLSGSGESCSVSTDLPTAAQLKKKVLALVRSKQEVEIDLGGPGRRPCVVFVELAKGIMDLINSYCHSVYLSVLMNPANQRGWSDLITRDLLDKFHGFLASLHVTVGLRQGQTLLPLPPREAVQEGAGPGKGSASASSKDRVHVLEGAVITWTKQVRYVLKQEPEHIFREGSPQPDAELQFWRSRANNLNSIHMQLQMEGVKRVLRFLDANKSTYVAPFARLQKEVEDGREEANDNVKFLKALESHVNALLNETQDFEVLEQVFDDVFHVLLLVWRHSKYYNSLARLAVIVRQICNSLIAQAQPAPQI